MEPAAERILANLRDVKGRIAAAAARSGRPEPGAVQLVAVTKSVGVEAIRVLLGAGQRVVGESRPQQLRDRASELEGEPVTWHMIGRLQRNKVKYVVPTAAMIHSVDSLALAEEIGRRATVLTIEPDADLSAGALAKEEAAGDASRTTEHKAVNGMIPPHPPPLALRRAGPCPSPAAGRGEYGGPGLYRATCLLEINSGEEQKTGFLPAEAATVAEAVAALPGIDLIGLMTMAPLADDPEASRPAFAALRELLEKINRAATLPRPLTQLSMGMSQDFEVAIEEGATIVRVGTALFIP